MEDLFGEVNKEYVKKVIGIAKKHCEVYGNKKMSLQSLDLVFEGV
jgi:hypothetical protein